MRLDLYVRPGPPGVGTRLSGPLLDAIRSGAINLRYIGIPLKKKSMTASELMAELNAEPTYLSARAKEEQARQERAAEWRRGEAPLVEELRSVGVAVESAWNLINNAASYPKALPILLKHLQRPYPDAVREGIARALAVPEAKFAWETLMRLYREEPEARPRPKDGMASALAAIADDKKIGDLISLVRDERNGSSRLLLLRALERSSDPSARKTLIELENDPELKKEISVILRRIAKRKKEKAFEPSTAPETMTDLAEASMNFDANAVEPFLQRLSPLIMGFGPTEIGQVLKAVDELEVDDERELCFQVTHHGQAVPLNIRIFKDDVDAPDLYFFAPQKLVEEINQQMNVFCEEYGI
jgi:hypothetical protein